MKLSEQMTNQLEIQGIIKLLKIPSSTLSKWRDKAAQLEEENGVLMEVFWMTFYYWMGDEFGPVPTDEEMYNKLAGIYTILQDTP